MPGAIYYKIVFRYDFYRGRLFFLHNFKGAEQGMTNCFSEKCEASRSCKPFIHSGLPVPGAGNKQLPPVRSGRVSTFKKNFSTQPAGCCRAILGIHCRQNS
jgi:hypothetical protein